MSDEPLDPVFRDGLRAELVRTVVTTRPRRRLWSRRRTFSVGGVLLLTFGGGGAALASGVLPAPGAEQVTLRSSARTVVHVGTATVDLGRRPSGTTSVELTLTCLTAGTFTFDDGANVSCFPGEVLAQAAPSVPTPGQPVGPGSAGYTLALEPGRTSTTITAAGGTRWSLTAAYSTRTPTGWALNGKGDTYGVAKPDGTHPDLVSVFATNGVMGYAYAGDLGMDPPDFSSPEEALAWQATRPPTWTVPVYTSDGVSVVGEFTVG